MGKGKKNLNNGSDNSSNNLNEHGNNSATDMKTLQWIGSATDEKVDQREKNCSQKRLDYNATNEKAGYEKTGKVEKKSYYQTTDKKNKETVDFEIEHGTRNKCLDSFTNNRGSGIDHTKYSLKKKNRIRKRVKEVNIVQRIAKYSKETFFKSICRY